MMRVTLQAEDVVQARQRIQSQVVETPILRSDDIDQALGLEVFFKCENLQKTGSFKLRGASHAVGLLPDDCPGVATHSSGNHGAALACAARDRGWTAHVVMPDNAVKSKIEAVRHFGGQVHLCAPTQAAREAGLAQLVQQGLAAVPPYDDERIIAGQGSCALELMEQVSKLDAIVAPVGGGGLIAGTALAALTRQPHPLVIGAEPLGADDTWRSLQRGERVDSHQPRTIADGLRALVGERNLAIIRERVDAIVRVDEAAIADAMRLLWQSLKQVVEPSAAVALAGLQADAQRWQGQRVGVILSGGNLDIAPMITRLFEDNPS